MEIALQVHVRNRDHYSERTYKGEGTNITANPKPSTLDPKTAAMHFEVKRLQPL